MSLGMVYIHKDNSGTWSGVFVWEKRLIDVRFEHNDVLKDFDKVGRFFDHVASSQRLNAEQIKALTIGPKQWIANRVSVCEAYGVGSAEK